MRKIEIKDLTEFVERINGYITKRKLILEVKEGEIDLFVTSTVGGKRKLITESIEEMIKYLNAIFEGLILNLTD